MSAVMSASLIGRLGSSAFGLSTAALSMSRTGWCFSSESAPTPFHHGIRGRGGTIFWSALPSNEQQVQADMRTHLTRLRATTRCGAAFISNQAWDIPCWRKRTSSRARYLVAIGEKRK